MKKERDGELMKKNNRRIDKKNQEQVTSLNKKSILDKEETDSLEEIEEHEEDEFIIEATEEHHKLESEDESTHEDEEEYDDVDDIEIQEVNYAKQDEEEKVKKHRRRRKKKEGKHSSKLPCMIVGGIIGGILLVYVLISLYFINHFFINTTINGKDFSGKNEEAVVSYLKDQVDDYRLKLIELEDQTDEISGDEIKLAYKENSDIKKALKAQNPLLWIGSLFSKTSTDVTINVSYDEKLLDNKIASIKAMTTEQTAPVSAHPKFDGETFVVESEVYGTAVNEEILKDKIKKYILEFKPEMNLLEEGCYEVPQYTSDSKEVKTACEEMNRYCSASITYTMTENVVVDKALISGWLAVDDNMQVTLNETAIREWMREFGKKYDTVGATRTITSPSGKTVDVSGGTYGWSIDEDAEAKKLIESIKNGEVTTREPAYAQTAASRSAQDWGSTYVEVDLSAQYMWYIVNGSVALQTDVVTGLPDPKHATPAGVYSILYTQANATLIGEKDPETGKPIYETKVRYWMPFTYQGHGFHDADWQSAFGGSRYQTYGSHGCVNMPVDQAGNLFGMLSAGTPVVLHY